MNLSYVRVTSRKLRDYVTLYNGTKRKLCVTFTYVYTIEYICQKYRKLNTKCHDLLRVKCPSPTV